MSADGPVVYLLSGLPGSGKTTYARNLEAHGVVRVSVDDAMLAAHGRLGVDYPAEEHLVRLAPVVESARTRLVDEVESGRSVVLDHGLGQRSERDAFKQLVVSLGATWQLIHFAVDLDVLRRRCAERLHDPDAVPISDDTLTFLAATWEVPQGEGEIVVDETGHRRR